MLKSWKSNERNYFYLNQNFYALYVKLKFLFLSFLGTNTKLIVPTHIGIDMESCSIEFNFLNFNQKLNYHHRNRFFLKAKFFNVN